VATFGVVLRLTLAMVYAAAAFGKLLSPRSTPLLLETFRLSPRLKLAVQALPALELTVAGALLVARTSRIAAAVSCLLLVLFSALVVRNISQGLAGTCNCFGRLHSSRIGWSTVVRNMVLISASALIAVPSDQARIWLLVSDLTGAGTNVRIAVAGAFAATSLAAAVVRGRTLRRRSAPTVTGALDGETGAFAPRPAQSFDPGSAQVVLLDDRVTTLAETLAAGTRNILVFIDPACGPCRSLLPDLQDLWPQMTERLLLVTRGPADLNRDLLAGFPADRSLLDVDDALMIRYGVLATPAAVVLSESGSRTEELVVGPQAIRGLARRYADGAGAHSSCGDSAEPLNEPSPPLSGEGLFPVTSSLQTVLSRRETLTAGMSAGLFASVASSLGRALDLTAKLLSTGNKGVQCPTCGTCTICDAPSPGSRPKELVCRPCKQKCTANDLCLNYANKLPAYLSIHSYLLTQGFSQSGEPTALGLQQNGAISFIGTNTSFTSKSSASPDALLMYTLTNTGGTASAAIFDSKGKITSVVATNSAGQVVSIDVASSPAMPSGAAAQTTSVDNKARGTEAADTTREEPRLRSDVRQEPERTAAADEAASCEEVCSAALAVMIGVLTPLAVAGEAASITTIKLALPLVKGILSAAVGGGFENDLALTTMGAAYTGASLLNLGEESEFGADIAKDTITSTAEKAICSTLICTVKLEGCCNYTGACYDLDSVCERNCPGGLKHPLAHCDVYLTRLGKKIKISTLVPGL